MKERRRRELGTLCRREGGSAEIWPEQCQMLSCSVRHQIGLERSEDVDPDAIGVRGFRLERPPIIAMRSAR